ncbi:TPR repeat region-containing protein [Nocardia carnea]|uniref:TPR repeat domain-containing protein n=1 Tax=Nocardia carnea TaxID=37328 RepID=A0ABW7TEG4_9NOCA
MPTRKQVESWNTAKLSEWATELETDTQHYETELGRLLPQFSGTSWSGAAHDAAADRFTEEHDQGRKLSQEIRDVAVALRNADQRLANERRLLLGKVGEAENDPTCPVRLQVADNWAVSGTGARLSQGDQQKVTDKVHAHQDAINAAYYSLANAVSEVGITITSATQEVRVRGDQIGDGVSVTSVSPNDSGGLGKEDGEALATWADGSLPDKENTEILEEIAGRLPQGTLTEEQLRVLAAGGEVDNLPADVQEYYRSLYQSAGKDGILALSEHLRTEEAAGNPNAAGQLDNLANGLMVVSNEDIGTGRNPDGTLTNPGSYQQLPESVRQLLESRRTDPDPLEPNVPGGPTAGLQKQWEDTNALAALFGEAHPAYEPGTELGTQMVLKSSDMVQDQFDWPDRDDAAAQFLGVAGRNDDSSHQIWTGEGMPDGYKPEETVRSLLSHDWSGSDNGVAASTMVNRITEEAALPADDPGVREADRRSRVSGRCWLPPMTPRYGKRVRKVLPTVQNCPRRSAVQFHRIWSRSVFPEWRPGSEPQLSTLTAESNGAHRKRTV